MARQQTLKPGDHLYLIDGSGYIFRAYHALPPLTRKSDGLPVGAVQGFCNMLWKLLKDTNAGQKPTHLAVIFDKSSKTFRNDIYPAYKAQRPEPPADLRPQFGLIKQATRAFNVPAIEQDNFEADDLIATYARQAVEAGATCRIVSSDKDLMQLIRPGVTLYDTMKDRDVGEAAVLEKFGVTPDKVIDVQSLAGDSVDNVPGVPGIGVKTAAQLIAEYGDLETLLARASEIKQQKRRENLIAVRRAGAHLQAAGDTRRPGAGGTRRQRFRRRSAQGLPAHRLPQGAGVHQLHQEGGGRTRRRHGGDRACAGGGFLLAAGGRRDHGGRHEGGSTRRGRHAALPRRRLCRPRRRPATMR